MPPRRIGERVRSPFIVSRANLGYAIGALLAGAIADIFGLEWAIGVVGGLTLFSGITAAIAMRETVHPIASPATKHA